MSEKIKISANIDWIQYLEFSKICGEIKLEPSEVVARFINNFTKEYQTIQKIKNKQDDKQE